MISAVLDSNVLVSGFSSPSGVPRQIVRLWVTKSFNLIVSEHILAEIRHAFADPYFATRHAPGRVDRTLAYLRQRSTIVEITTPVYGVATHESDDAIIATAASAGASYLVTGDRELRRIDNYQGVAIVTAPEFLAILQSEKTQS